MSARDAVIGIIGCGNMGSALVEHVKKKLVPRAVIVFDKDKTKETSLVNGFDVRLAKSVSVLVAQSDVIVIAVKPQDIEALAKQISGLSGKLIVSIVAGVAMGHLGSLLSCEAAIVRAMPNLNALIGASVTALCRNNVVSESQWGLAQKIFYAVGDVVFVDEKQLNAVTAISGSGPAFVAYLISVLDDKVLENVLSQEAIAFGIDAATANVLAKGTVAGTRRILSLNFDADMLIKRICSKGGTTEAGMRVLLEKGKTLEALHLALGAAKKRADELLGQ